MAHFNFEKQKIITWKDNSGGWRDVKGWPGIITENAVQAIARDLLAEAMLRIDAVGLPIVATVHDEIVCEVPERGSDRVLEQFASLMMVVPEWAKGLPVVAKAWKDRRYIK